MVKDSVTTSYTYNINNQLLTETSPDANITYSYDGSGNMVSKTDANDANNNATYSWNWRNHLLSVSEPDGNTAYEYDGDGTRISKTQSSVKTKYINDVALPLVQVLMETNSTGTVQAVYNYGHGLISMKRADANSYYHYDGLGSTVSLSNVSGNVAEKYRYDAFGQPTILSPSDEIRTTSDVGNAYGFTGQQQFGEADSLVYLRARYYKPSIGRFLSPDPIGYEGGLNLYAYVRNNPINRIDPLGFSGYVGGGFGAAEGMLLPEDYQSTQKGECPAIDGYYRHCVATCRLTRITGPLVSYPAALTAGDDWPSDNETENNVSDRRADRQGIRNAYKFWKSCRNSCKKSMENAIKKYCPPPCK